MLTHCKYFPALLAVALLAMGCGTLDHPAMQLNLVNVPGKTGRIDITLTAVPPPNQQAPDHLPTGTVSFYRDATNHYLGMMPPATTGMQMLGEGPSAVSLIVDLPVMAPGMLMLKVETFEPPPGMPGASTMFTLSAGACMQAAPQPNQLVMISNFAVVPKSAPFDC